MTEPSTDPTDELAAENAQVADEDHDVDPRTLTGGPADAPTELGRAPELDESEL